jgi:type VI protein secretion system component Hcp
MFFVLIFKITIVAVFHFLEIDVHNFNIIPRELDSTGKKIETDTTLDSLKLHIVLDKSSDKLNAEPSIGDSRQVSVHLTKQFQRRRFLEINQPETRIAYSSHVC